METLPALSEEQAAKMIKVIYGGDVLSWTPGIRYMISGISGTKEPFIESTGMPGMGKTTLCHEADVEMKRLGIRHTLIEEVRPNFAKDVYEAGWGFVMLHKIVNKIIEIHAQEESHGLVLVDRGINNEIAFLHANVKVGIDDQESIGLAEKYFMRYFRNFIDGLIIIHGLPNNSMKRTNTHDGFFINPTYLPHLEEAFKNLPERLAYLRYRPDRKDNPLLLAEIDGNQELSAYRNIFLRTIGWMHMTLARVDQT